MKKLIGKILFRGQRFYQNCVNQFLDAKYRAGLAHIGRGVRFNGLTRITGLDQIEIGDNVHVGEGAFIRGEGGLKIGDNTHIARNLTLYTHSHEFEGLRLPYDDQLRKRPVTVGKNVWIGINVTILPGTEIGDGAIIGGGSLVAGKVPPLAIFGGALAQNLKSRDEKHYWSLEQAAQYGGQNGRKINE